MRQSASPGTAPDDLRLVDGSRVAVIGGGPAGSFFSCFLLAMAERVGLALDVDLYEPRDFRRPGPQGCNMCGGIVSESLVQNLAMEGITLPPSVVQPGIDSYVLHMDVGSVRIDLPLHGAGARPQGLSLVGEPVVLAFQLEKLAGDDTGTILTCGRTRALAGTGFAFRDLDEIAPRGFHQRSHVYALLEGLDQATTRGPAVPLEIAPRDRDGRSVQ